MFSSEPSFTSDNLERKTYVMAAQPRFTGMLTHYLQAGDISCIGFKQVRNDSPKHLIFHCFLTTIAILYMAVPQFCRLERDHCSLGTTKYHRIYKGLPGVFCPMNGEAIRTHNFFGFSTCLGPTSQASIDKKLVCYS